MKVEIFGKNYNVSDSLQKITEKKCAKLDKYFSDDKNAVAKVQVTLENGDYETELTVTYKTQTYRASAISQTPFDNIDLVIPKLLGQIRKQKDIWSKGKKGKPNQYDEEDIEVVYQLITLLTFAMTTLCIQLMLFVVKNGYHHYLFIFNYSKH